MLTRRHGYGRRMFIRYFTLVGLLAGSQIASADTVQLKDKSSVSGRVLAEKRDILAVDIGYTVLTIPRNQVVKVIKESETDRKSVV